MSGPNKILVCTHEKQSIFHARAKFDCEYPSLSVGNAAVKK